MWAKLDDALLDHPKILAAGREFGRNGRVLALGLYAAGLLHANRYLTDGFLATAVVEEMRYIERPLTAAATMVRAGLWEQVEGGFKVHDFLDFNPAARDVLDKRKRDRERKQHGGRQSRGNGRA